MTTTTNTNTDVDEAIPELPRHVGFARHMWDVHKFGGTSVANATCFRTVAGILQDRLVEYDDDAGGGGHLAVVVSAMGGKPKTTDLLLEAVERAAARREVTDVMNAIRVQHGTCLQDLFQNNEPERTRLWNVIEQDLQDVCDILKTVSLMKWNASRIAQVVSGYGELWSTQILCALMQQQQQQQQQSRLIYHNHKSVVR
mmetsp:Transcript_415/g.931  ORF Transcript_415/g.931 Transcript_415/m.931 type:complete len:199 (-) Transcript_415:32-628(-)